MAEVDSSSSSSSTGSGAGAFVVARVASSELDDSFSGAGVVGTLAAGAGDFAVCTCEALSALRT